MFFSNTNRGCFFEHESNESNESCKCVALAFLRTVYMYARQQYITRQS